MKRPPYGISDFARIRHEDYYYVDKTSYIELIEQQPPYLFPKYSSVANTYSKLVNIRSHALNRECLLLKESFLLRPGTFSLHYSYIGASRS